MPQGALCDCVHTTLAPDELCYFRFGSSMTFLARARHFRFARNSRRVAGLAARGCSCTFIITSGKITDSLHSAPAEKNPHR